MLQRGGLLLAGDEDFVPAGRRADLQGSVYTCPEAAGGYDVVEACDGGVVDAEVNRSSHADDFVDVAGLEAEDVVCLSSREDLVERGDDTLLGEWCVVAREAILDDRGGLRVVDGFLTQIVDRLADPEHRAVDDESSEHQREDPCPGPVQLLVGLGLGRGGGRGGRSGGGRGRGLGRPDEAEWHECQHDRRGHFHPRVPVREAVGQDEAEEQARDAEGVGGLSVHGVPPVSRLRAPPMPFSMSVGTRRSLLLGLAAISLYTSRLWRLRR